MKSYLRRLPSHPGFGVAIISTAMGAAAGRHGGIRGVIVGAAVMSILWVPVLITNLSRYD